MEYGMHIGYYAMPEEMWGYDFVTSCYKEEPKKSKAKIENQMMELYSLKKDSFTI